MLNQIRSASKTWVATVIVAILVAAFVLWGVPDVFLRAGSDAVAVVGKRQVTVAQLSSDFDRELMRLNEQAGGEIDRQTALRFGLDRQVLQRLATRAAMEQKTDALGLVATDDAVVREMTKVPAFHDPITGRFDQNAYLEVLSRYRLPPRQFERDLALDIVQTQLAAALGAPVEAPAALAAARSRFLGETRALSIVAIPADAAGDIAEPTPEELQAFYTEHSAAYATPPRRGFSLATLTLDDFMADAKVDEALLRETYESRRDTLRTPETRDVVELSAPDEATAAEVATRLRAGEAPEAVAQALGLAPPNTYDDATPDRLVTRALADAAFATEPGQVTDPVDGGIAWFVARVDAANPSVEQTFEQARPELERELAVDVAEEQLFTAYDAFESALSQGASLDDAAQAAGVPVFTYGLLDQRGADENGRPAQLAPEILSAVFGAAAEGVTSEVLELGDSGYFAVRVDRIVPESTRPLAEIEPQVRAQFAQVRQAEALNALAETAQARLTEGASPTDAASAVAPGARGEVSDLRRDQATPTVGRDVLARVFASSQGDVVVGATPGGGRVVVRVDAIRAAEDPAPEAVAAARDQLTAEVSEDLAQLFQTGLQKEFPVKVDETLLARATGADTGQ